MRYGGIGFEKWLAGFEDIKESVISSVEQLKQHPLVPEDIHIYG